ncbi:MAG: hypothetical protein K8T25_24325, partial [Planctomycetia bacterium]|nr:hypothetical protein [Planctomycetia bacterium]
PWDKNPVFKYWDLDRLDDSAQVLLRYGNGRPAIVEQRVGRGRVLTLTTSLTESTRRPWNLLLMPQPEAWPGFALITGMAQYLVGRVEEKTNYLVGQVAVLRMGKDELFDSYLLTTPLGDTVKIREQEGLIRFDDTKVPGQYQLRAGGETDVRRGLSVNVDPAATRLARVDEKTLLKDFDKTSFRLARNTDDLVRQRRAGEAVTRWEAYPWLVLLVALAVIGENLLSSLFYRK